MAIPPAAWGDTTREGFPGGGGGGGHRDCSTWLQVAIAEKGSPILQLSNLLLQGWLPVRGLFWMCPLIGFCTSGSTAMSPDSCQPVPAGVATGKLIEVQRIEPGAVQSEVGEDVVLLVHEATGDEEVSATGVPLKGVILAHSLPHLSHLGVRARQEKVVFVTCEDADTMTAAVKPLIGQKLVAHDCTLRSTASSYCIIYSVITTLAGFRHLSHITWEIAHRARFIFKLVWPDCSIGGCGYVHYTSSELHASSVVVMPACMTGVMLKL